MDITAYQLIDTLTGRILRTYAYAQRNACRAARDRMDNAYGAYRYQARPVFIPYYRGRLHIGGSRSAFARAKVEAERIAEKLNQGED
jgi:hypothetical protein